MKANSSYGPVVTGRPRFPFKLAVIGRREEGYDNFQFLNGIVSCDDINAVEYLTAIELSEEYLGEVGEVFNNLRVLVIKAQYDFQKALLFLSKRVSNSNIKSFLERLGRALIVGTSLRDFLRIEFTSYASEQKKMVERGAEKMKLIVDMYAALTSASILLFTTLLMVQGVFGFADLNTVFSILLSVILAMALTSSYMAGRAIPVATRLLHKGRNDVAKIISIALTVLIISIITIAALVALSFAGSPPIAVFIAFASIGLLGFLFYRVRVRPVLSRVMEINATLPSILRTMADLLSAGGLRGTVNALAEGNWGGLTAPLKRLKARLAAGIPTRTAFKMFFQESESEMLRIHMGLLTVIQTVGLNLQGATEVLLESIAIKQDVVKKRTALASYARGLILPLHAAFVGVSVIVSELIKLFERVSMMAGADKLGIQTPFFAYKISASLNWLPLIIVFTSIMILVNAYLLVRIEGGWFGPFAESISQLMLVTGIAGLLSYVAGQNITLMINPVGAGG
jgi:archaellum biogenesis protein FlaJ (TadC family)